ncbi:MAG: hypothetical protein Q4C95_00560 [Planctomycetia bacterium]|nr:hypothetical protein [Planctomycetia bacterium]
MASENEDREFPKGLSIKNVLDNHSQDCWNPALVFQVRQLLPNDPEAVWATGFVFINSPVVTQNQQSGINRFELICCRNSQGNWLGSKSVSKHFIRFFDLIIVRSKR